MYINILNSSCSFSRLEMDGDRKVGQLLQTIDELVKIAPELIAGARVTPSVRIQHFTYQIDR